MAEVIHPHAFKLEASWEAALDGELKKKYIADLAEWVHSERSVSKEIYPPESDTFKALWKTPFSKVKVVIVGQDPYHGPGQANGLCFSVNPGVPFPPSLKNIFKELCDDLHVPYPTSGDLTPWAEQGVLLLNATLTVEEKHPLSHHGQGWEQFTDAIIEALCERRQPVLFILWGSSAYRKCESIRSKCQGGAHHPILTTVHPSPLSAYRGFFGCRHFSKANALLVEIGESPIDWRLN